MLLKFSTPKLLADLISIVSELASEVKVKVNKEGLEITAIDPANIALVSLKMPSSTFTQFVIDKEDELGINLDDLKQILRRASSASSLTIERENNALKLKIENGSKRTFKLSLINVEQEEKKIPDLKFNAKIEMDAVTFGELVNDALIVADSCNFIAKPNSFVIDAKGTLNEARTEMSSDELKIDAKDSKSKYSLEYLSKFIKASRLTDKLTIQFANDYPTRFDFKHDAFDLAFVLAPRIEEE